MLFHRVKATPTARAFAGPGPDGSGVVWHTWAQIGERVTRIAAGLRQLGVTTGERVALLSGTRVEWVLADLGINVAGAATTTIYPTTGAEDAVAIVMDSGAMVLIAESPEQAAKLTGRVPAVTSVVLIDGNADRDAQPPQLTLADLEALGEQALAATPALIDEVVAALGPDDLASLVYTSGTTGRARGVELTHTAWIWQAVAQEQVDLLSPDGLLYLWLPLSHAYGKALCCGIIHVGSPTYFDGRVDKIAELLPVVRPTIMPAAPRIFEKIHNRIVLNVAESGGLTSKIFSWAVATGRRKVAREQAGRAVGALLQARYAIAEKLVFSKLQNRLGGKGIVLISGSAPLSRDIAEFFAAAGLPILEGYGLTESSASTFCNRRGANRIGTVGPALGDLEVKIADDGEILLRGRALMRGYHGLPDATREAFTPDGFLRTGDIGVLDADGHLRITDRKKDLVKTSGGKYIAPSAVENQFKAVCPYVAQVMVVAHGRKFASMLVTLDEEAIVAWAGGDRPYSEVVAAPDTERLIAGYIEQLNAKLNRWETIKRFMILPRELSVDRGEVTASMKIKRAVVERAFADEIAEMYDQARV
uniref:AMP-dependent synthetase/ligase n=1 Tax=Paractinoplanes polyasparticus TaxID=2856853 RepID=UPI001C863F67|nr:long-chain fatty acid--CoA ligase [Actinoplanes polyasparticus]